MSGTPRAPHDGATPFTIQAKFNPTDMVRKVMDYYPSVARAVTELVLNAIEEGARVVRLFVTREAVELWDDGSGMDQRMVQAANDVGWSIKRGKLVSGGFHGTGSKAWGYFGRSLEVMTRHIETAHEAEAQSRDAGAARSYGPSTVRCYHLHRNSLDQTGWPCEVPGEFREEPQVPPQDIIPPAPDGSTTFTLFRIRDLTKRTDVDRLREALADQLPPGGFCEVSVNGTTIPSRTYEGDAITSDGITLPPFSYRVGEETITADLRVAIYVVSQPRPGDGVAIVVQGRPLLLAVLRESVVGIPAVFFVPGVAGWIFADYLAPLTTSQRTGFTDTDAPAFDHLVQCLRKLAPKVESRLEQRAEAEGERAHRKLVVEAVVGVTEALRASELFREALAASDDAATRCPTHPTDPRPQGHHRCKALADRKLARSYDGPLDICVSCCKASWQAVRAQGSSSIAGCLDGCRYFGEEFRRPPGAPPSDDGDASVLAPDDDAQKGAGVPFVRLPGGRSLYVSVTSLPQGEASRLDRSGGCVYVNKDHPVFRYYDGERDRRVIDWMRMLLFVEAANYAGQAPGIGWTFTLDLLRQFAEQQLSRPPRERRQSVAPRAT